MSTIDTDMGFWLVDIGHSVGQRGIEQWLVDIGQRVGKGWSGKHWTLHSFKSRISMQSVQLLKYEMLAECRLTGTQQDSLLRPYKFKSQYLRSVQAHKMWPPSSDRSGFSHSSRVTLLVPSDNRTNRRNCRQLQMVACQLLFLFNGYLGHCPWTTAYCRSHVGYGTAGHDKITKDPFAALRAHQNNCKMCASDRRLIWPIVRINWRTAERIFMTCIQILTKIWHNKHSERRPTQFPLAWQI